MATQIKIGRIFNKELAELIGVPSKNLIDVDIQSHDSEIATATLSYNIKYRPGDKIHSDSVGLAGLRVSKFSVDYEVGRATVTATIHLNK